MRFSILLLSGALLVSASALANRPAENSRMGNTDVVVDMPPEVWTQGQNTQQNNCLQCCTYENRSYSEGAVVKAEGVLLQCARDDRVLGTNPLIWKIIK
ncbi:YnjH family protein [Pantoea sp. Mb-10]|uniref:YnjH family protein n=1 Tax=unclassified Pantoea TaxID=2630326 RepID=UPI001E65788D|nr:MULTISPECIES: YnjH family protein [unclassified Pantoea]MCE0491480.1 YnjH family protein [Pantoea sp. Mb-10]MCE0502294.1 YnjH family protein [Pantoea sp. Pb-8]